MLNSILSHAEDNVSGAKYRFKQLQELEIEINWDDLLLVIEPHYQAFSVGRSPVSAETMIRIYFIQLRYGMNAAGAEEALFQIEVLREFALVKDNRGVIPDESSIKAFNRLVREQGYGAKFENAFDLVRSAV